MIDLNEHFLTLSTHPQVLNSEIFQAGPKYLDPPELIRDPPVYQALESSHGQSHSIAINLYFGHLFCFLVENTPFLWRWTTCKWVCPSIYVRQSLTPFNEFISPSAPLSMRCCFTIRIKQKPYFRKSAVAIDWLPNKAKNFRINQVF